MCIRDSDKILQMSFVVIYLLFISVTSFAVFGTDKFLAKNSRARISEATLLVTTFFGGTIGSVLAMFIFNHKIAKRSFLMKFFIVVSVQLLLIYLFYRYGIK